MAGLFTPGELLKLSPARHEGLGLCPHQPQAQRPVAIGPVNATLMFPSGPVPEPDFRFRGSLAKAPRLSATGTPMKRAKSADTKSSSPGPAEVWSHGLGLANPLGRA